MITLLAAFLERDFRTETSYRVSFLLNLSSIFFTVFTYFFVAQLVGEGASDVLAEYDGDYFSFVVIGIAFAGYFGLGLNGFSQALRLAQTTGTLEAMMMTPVPVSLIVLGSSAWSYAYTTLRMAILLLIGWLFLGLSLNDANYAGALVTLLLSIIAFASFGIVAAAVIMVIKRGDPVTTIFGSVAALIGGVLYPVEIMPEWLQFLARLLPITYALEAMRAALLRGAGWSDLAPDLAALSVFALVVFPFSLLLFRYAVRRARQDGSLTHY